MKMAEYREYVSIWKNAVNEYAGPIEADECWSMTPSDQTFKVIESLIENIPGCEINGEIVPTYRNTAQIEWHLYTKYYMEFECFADHVDVIIVWDKNNLSFVNGDVKNAYQETITGELSDIVSRCAELYKQFFERVEREVKECLNPS